MDIVQFLQDHNIPYTSKGKNVGKGWIAFCCPFCSDTDYHGGFPLSGAYAYCWRCGGHKLETTLRKLTGMSQYEIQQELQQYDGTDSFYAGLNEKRSTATSIELPGISLIFHDRKYLKKRGFDPDFLAEKYGLKSGGIAGEWQYRILIPIYYKGKLVSWQGRDTSGEEGRIRYKTLPIERSVMDAKSVLFNLDNCKGDSIIVCEGPFAAMRLGDDCCATLGTSTTEEQTRLLTRYKRVVTLFDSEPQAQERARKLAGKVAAFGVSVEVCDLELTDGRDPGDLSIEEVKKVRRELDFPELREYSIRED